MLFALYYGPCSVFYNLSRLHPASVDLFAFKDLVARLLPLPARNSLGAMLQRLTNGNVGIHGLQAPPRALTAVAAALTLLCMLLQTSAAAGWAPACLPFDSVAICCSSCWCLSAAAGSNSCTFAVGTPCASAIMLPATQPHMPASCRLSPVSSPARKPPQKAFPQPVTSTTWVLGTAGT
jgi:hypothetical protein